MSSNVITINCGGVNCYLAKCTDGFVLIDSGLSTKRDLLLSELRRAGCEPGTLRFILVTHGDADHAGNGAFLQKEFHAPIGMHKDDFGMVERGDMSWNRKPRADKMSLVMKVVGAIVRLAARNRFETFTPDVAVDDGYDLAVYGFKARVVHIPGHSKGSVGVLTETGDLYCGDFLYTTPGLNFVDDMKARSQSLSSCKSSTYERSIRGMGNPCTRSGKTQPNMGVGWRTCS